MRKSILFLSLLLALLSGCQTVTAKRLPAAGPPPVQVESPQQQGRIAWSPLTPVAIGTTLYMEELPDSFQQVQYRIWRTADGSHRAKLFTAAEAARQFSLDFNLAAFGGKRGEYHIEAVGVQADGSHILLDSSTLTFQQYVPILMYHGIDEYHGQGIRDLFVPPAHFEAQMRYIKEHGYTPLTFERWNEINLVDKPIFITFDDGMKDNLHALHILEQLQDDRFQPAATEYVIAGAVDKAGFLSAADILQMQESGIFSIQSHTLTHADLLAVSDYESEFKKAKERIEGITGKPVISVAYPGGRYTEQVLEEAKKYYQYGVTVQKGQYIDRGRINELYRLERIHISPQTSMDKFVDLIQEKLLP